MKRLILATLLTLVVSSFAFAGFERTIHYQFDVLSPEAQNLEAGLVFDYNNESDWLTAWVLDAYAKYGILDNWEVGFDVPYIGWDVDGWREESGLGDVNVWTKYRFINEEESCCGLAAGVNVKLATGEQSEGLGTGHVDWMPFIMGTIKPADQITLGAKVGYNRVSDDDNNDRDDEWNYGIWGGYAIQDNLSIVGEIYGKEVKGDDPLTFDAGVTYGIAENVGLVGGAGWGLNNAAWDWHVFLGIKGNFPIMGH
ncbi:MAG: transporter [bacterium]|nr:transporter [bacterium]